MQLRVKGRNLQVTDALFEHAEQKLSRLSRHLPPWDDASEVEVELSVEHPGRGEPEQVVEITVRTKGPVLRVREASEDMYQAIDAAARRLDRQARRYRERRKRRGRGGEREMEPLALPRAVEPDVAEPEPVEEIEAPVIVKSKVFAMKPMSPEDAALQMDLLQHDFYVFTSADSGQLSVVYRRRDGNYGLIGPDA